MKRTLLGISCLLIVVSTIIPTTATYVTIITPQSLTSGNVLYVGGLGPNNYTKIQDAINDAVNGDTIFVYDDSSPYYENIFIQKSISVIGEKKETTSILGDNSTDAIVNISADDVSISGFTIQSIMGKPAGIIVDKNYTTPDFWNIAIIKNVTISNNIIKNTWWAGIFTIRLNNGKIIGNEIEQCDGSGILLFISSEIIITQNVISDCSYRGIEISGVWNFYRIKNSRNPVSENNIITQNIIRNNRWGIELNSGPVNTTISKNNITKNYETGIQIIDASKTKITQNNFLDNSKNAYFMAVCFVRYPRFLLNTWDGNYWGEATKLPVRVNGDFYVILFPRIPVSISFEKFSLTEWKIPWIMFDKHPAQEPYDIL